MRRLLILALAVAGVSAMSGDAPRVTAAAECARSASPGDIQAAIDTASRGDVICMAEGVYRGPLRFESKGGVTLRGAGAGRTIVAGGAADGLLVFNSSDLLFEDFTLFFGYPSNAYIWRSTNVRFARMDIGGGAIGIHYDVNSTGTVSDSFVYAMSADGILTRRGANVTVERNWVFLNGGVGVSTVGETATTTVVRNIISDNAGPGVFAGQTPCALLPPGFVEVPECYLRDLRAFVGAANVILDTNVIQASGSTGIVLFPGTRGTFRNNRVWSNELSGLFAWGSTFSSDGDEYALNEEHAIEARAYPDPLKYPQIRPDDRIRAAGLINRAVIRDSVVLAETGTLGGGVLAQGANLDVMNSRVYGNRGIGVSYVNTSLGRIVDNDIFDNRGSAICVWRAGAVTIEGNRLSGNADNAPGVCRETTP